jgi:hypothetical protein
VLVHVDCDEIKAGFRASHRFEQRSEHSARLAPASKSPGQLIDYTGSDNPRPCSATTPVHVDVQRQLSSTSIPMSTSMFTAPSVVPRSKQNSLGDRVRSLREVETSLVPLALTSRKSPRARACCSSRQALASGIPTESNQYVHGHRHVARPLATRASLTAASTSRKWSRAIREVWNGR